MTRRAGARHDRAARAAPIGSEQPRAGRQIEKAPALAAFISYAKQDSEKAQEIADQLEEHGCKYWIAPRDVRPGRAYGDEIIRGIERSRAFILVLSSASNASGFVSREIERAVSKNKPIFTIRVEDVQPAPALELFVSSTQWIDVFKGRLSLQIDRLAQLLGEDEGVAAPSASLAQPPPARDRPLWRSPYVLVGIVGESGPESAFASGRMPFPASFSRPRPGNPAPRPLALGPRPGVI